ncbi:Aldo/keto reductase subgroup [Penicillium macrosclerotiorum]|uniref:Aldo/keto reductase subgroup n=1 Tax=Penicillium macrosclerotiorum TaxID=303699 RepID=UPI002548D493|nr:Aldo/keto reductase subgroup [Penicillium macrosclerotiorum]KAJ5698861.1 Aldo/keto reductase subgroup [Penicillium macrosclerotiorum]
MAGNTLQSTRKLVSGYEIPVVGFGVGLYGSHVYQTPADVTERVTLKALELGYRHVDSAKVYQNEKESAAAIRKSGLDRSQIFYTSKVPRTYMGYEKAKLAIDESIAAADLGYIDLMLIHAPYGGKEQRLGTWRALVEAQKAGKIRSLGVSNFGVQHLEELEAYIQSGAGGQISVGQYEIHPWCPRDDVAEWLQKRNIVVEAYSPLVQATRMKEPVLQKLAQKHDKSPAQILIRWSLQKGYVPLPKSVTDARILENSQVFDFVLSDEDMASLKLNEYAPVCWDPVRDCKI